VDTAAKLEVADRCLDKLCTWVMDAQKLLDSGRLDLYVLENCRDVIDNCAEHPEVLRRCRGILDAQTFEDILRKPHRPHPGGTAP